MVKIEIQCICTTNKQGASAGTRGISCFTLIKHISQKTTELGPRHSTEQLSNAEYYSVAYLTTPGTRQYRCNTTAGLGMTHNSLCGRPVISTHQPVPREAITNTSQSLHPSPPGSFASNSVTLSSTGWRRFPASSTRQNTLYVRSNRLRFPNRQCPNAAYVPHVIFSNHTACLINLYKTNSGDPHIRHGGYPLRAVS